MRISKAGILFYIIGEGTGPGTHREEGTGQDLSLVSHFKGRAAVCWEPDFTSQGSLITSP